MHDYFLILIYFYVKMK